MTINSSYLYNSPMSDSSILKSFLSLFSGFLIVQAGLFAWIHAWPLVILNVFALVINILLLVFCRENTAVACRHAFNLCFLSYYAVLGFRTGGFFSIAMVMLFFVPVFASMFQDLRFRIFYPVLAGLIFMGFYAGQRIAPNILTADRIINISLYRFSNLFLILVFFAAVIWVFAQDRLKTQRLVETSQNECRRMAQDAEKALKIKDEFLANMSHEIRNPMNGIIGMMHVLLDTDLDEEQKSYADVVYNSARALLTIVNDILDLSKIEAGKLELDIRDFDLEIAVRDMVSLPAVLARQKGLDFSWHIDSEVPCRLQGDIGRIRQVVNNLLGNAVKFTEAGQVSLTISLESETEDLASVCFSVEDTGIGISDDKKDVLFNSFTQADTSITRKYGGTGLGLAISKFLVEKMGGKIGLDSIEMIGSTFFFTLPLKKQPERVFSPGSDNPEPGDCRILVISDDSSIGVSFEKNLGELDIVYEQAMDETEAFEMLKWASDENRPYHLVIAEAKENDEIAWKLGKIIREHTRFDTTGLILLTSVGQKGDAKRFENAGFDAFLSKPVQKSLFHDCIRQVLARRARGIEDNLSIITKYSIMEAQKHSWRVLIVEDMATNRLTAQALIARMGYQTDMAENGLKAVEKYKNNHYDLILMDCQMPEMDGFEATRKIRDLEKAEKRGHVPIIAMTGNVFESDRQKCFDNGMDDFIAKPVEPDVLMRKISSNLNTGENCSGETDSDQHIVMPDIIEHPEPARPDSGSSCVVFDKAQLYERFGNDDQLIRIVMDSFFQDAPELLDNIKTAIENNDAESVRSNAHALKGCAANVNAQCLKKAARALEDHAKQMNSQNFASAFETLAREYEIFIRETDS